ncbi:hypothetical protein [Undibacterium luofuense]|uniref:hypothetical protein n=1 Tax=Undibacterium luofuense TaxID=2828733 RepID=UPI0030EE05DA
MQIESSLSGLKQGNHPTLLAAYTQLGARTEKALQPQTIPKENGIVLKQADFTQMSRRELSDWVQLQVRSGRLSDEQANEFQQLMRGSPENQVQDGFFSDSSADYRVNFIALATEHVKQAAKAQQNDLLMAHQRVLETLQSAQGDVIGIRAVA